MERAGILSPIRIGILQFIPQLDDAVWGFRKTLEADLGSRVQFEIRDAEGRHASCASLAGQLVEIGCSLLFGCLTPAAAALKEAGAPTRTPVVFAPVYHPILSGLLPDEEHPGSHVTGVTGRIDPQIKIEKITLLFPALNEVTILAKRGDAVSVWDANSLGQTFHLWGIEAEILEVAEESPHPSNPGKLHVLAFSPDLEETMDQWIERFHRARTPVVGSSPRAGARGAVLSVFADHGVLGEMAGEMAAEILTGSPPSEMPVRHPPEAKIGFNYYAAGKVGLRIPPRLGQLSEIL